jgi:hypothetical protein
MFGSARLFVRAFQADLERLKVRTVTAAICYVIAALVFAAAGILGGAAVVILLTEQFGLVAGLAISAAILVAVGLVALAVNAILRARHRRLKRHAAAVRSAAIANSAAAGAETAQNATPALLPAAAILAFALTNAFLKPSRSGR